MNPTKTQTEKAFDSLVSGLEHVRAQVAEQKPAQTEAASELVRNARQYYPKSIRNHDTFHLLNVGAAIDKALYRASTRSL